MAKKVKKTGFFKKTLDLMIILSTILWAVVAIIVLVVDVVDFTDSGKVPELNQHALLTASLGWSVPLTIAWFRFIVLRSIK